jgi:hypothetical protein
MAVRGVTCDRCNSLLGFARDDINVLRNAVLYLERASVLQRLGYGAADCWLKPVNLHLWSAGEENMIAAVEMPDRLCIVRWVGRRGFKVRVLTGCGLETDASEGVVQVPSYVMDGRPVASVSDFGGAGRRMLKLCEKCKTAMS